jgi:hypothetical protein
MLEIELFRWYLNGSKKPTSWRMTRDDALARDPAAKPDLASREVRTSHAQGNTGAAVVAAGGGVKRPE